MDNPRDLYRKTVFFRGAGAMKQGDETNAGWTPTVEAVNPAHPIRWNLRHWIELTPRPEVADPLAYFAENKGENLITIVSSGVRHLRVLVHPRMVDMDKPVRIEVNGEPKFEGIVAPDLGFMLDLVREFDDRGRIFYGHVDIDIATDLTVDDPVYPPAP